MLRRVWSEIKDILFPIFCVECGKEGEWWCRACREKKTITIKTYEALPPLDSVEALFVYNEKEPVGRLLREFKYAGARDIVRVWRDWAQEFAPELARRWKQRGNYMLVPVPLHKRRERERGYNQAQILSEVLASALAAVGSPLEIAAGLARVRQTAQQARLPKTERALNVSGAFAWVAPIPPPKEVIIIDDVFTTGATACECARILKQAGASHVYAFTLAHG